MAQFRVALRQYGNTPVLVEATTQEEADALVAEQSPEWHRAQGERSLRARQKRTGLSDADVESMLGGLGHKAQGEGILGSEVMLGVHHNVRQRIASVRQLAAQLTGDKEEAARILEQSQREQELWKQIDEGVGMEDVGEIAPEVAAFLGGGLTSLAARGAVMGATSRPMEEDESRAARAVGGAAGAVAIPFGLKFLGGIRSTASALHARIGIPLANRARMYVGIPSGGGGANIVAQAVDMVEDATSPAQRRIGEAVLARMDNLLNKNPPSWIKNEALFGALRRPMDAAVRTTAAGARILDIGKLNQALSSMTSGKLNKAVGEALAREIKTFQQAVAAVGRTGMQLSEAQAERLAVAVQSAPLSSWDAVRGAMAQALDRPVKERIFEGFLSAWGTGREAVESMLAPEARAALTQAGGAEAGYQLGQNEDVGDAASDITDYTGSRLGQLAQ